MLTQNEGLENTYVLWSATARKHTAVLDMSNLDG